MEGGNDNAQAARGSNQGRGVQLIIASFQHGGKHNNADRGDGGRRRAGDRAEERAGYNRNNADAAGQPAEECISHGTQPLGEAAAFHQGASQDEVRNGHQGEGVQRAEQPGADGRKTLCAVSNIVNEDRQTD